MCQTIKEIAYKVKQVVIENIKYMYKISRKVTIYWKNYSNRLSYNAFVLYWYFVSRKSVRVSDVLAQTSIIIKTIKTISPWGWGTMVIDCDTKIPTIVYSLCTCIARPSMVISSFTDCIVWGLWPQTHRLNFNVLLPSLKSRFVFR